MFDLVIDEDFAILQIPRERFQAFVMVLQQAERRLAMQKARALEYNDATLQVEVNTCLKTLEDLTHLIHDRVHNKPRCSNGKN